MRPKWQSLHPGTLRAQRRWDLQLPSAADAHRQDALVTASEVVLAVEALALQHAKEPVATVGRLEVCPNAANVVPGSVKLTVDLRDLAEYQRVDTSVLRVYGSALATRYCEKHPSGPLGDIPLAPPTPSSRELANLKNLV